MNRNLSQRALDGLAALYDEAPEALTDAARAFHLERQAALNANMQAFGAAQADQAQAAMRRMHDNLAAAVPRDPHIEQPTFQEVRPRRFDRYGTPVDARPFDFVENFHVPADVE